MKNKFYAVKTMCGHVGNGKYREVTFPINADSGKEAAEIARWIPRVKHHKKDAIIDVEEISYEEYRDLIELNSNDPYLQCSNIQEQNLYCENIYLEVKNMFKEENDDLDRRMERVIYKQRKNKVIEADFKNYFRLYNNEMIYAIQ